MSSESGSHESLADQGKQLFGKVADMVGERSGGPTEMFVVMFDDESQASQVLDTLRRLEDEQLVDLGKAAVVTRRATDGTVDIEETSDLDTTESTIAGAAAGGLLSMLGGKGLLRGALLGAGGGALASKAIDLGLDDDSLQEVGDQLEPGTSALVAMVDIKVVKPTMEALDRFEGGTILRHTLEPGTAQALSAALED